MARKTTRGHDAQEPQNNDDRPPSLKPAESPLKAPTPDSRQNRSAASQGNKGNDIPATRPSSPRQDGSPDNTIDAACRPPREPRHDPPQPPARSLEELVASIREEIRKLDNLARNASRLEEGIDAVRAGFGDALESIEGTSLLPEPSSPPLWRNTRGFSAKRRSQESAEAALTLKKAAENGMDFKIEPTADGGGDLTINQTKLHFSPRPAYLLKLLAADSEHDPAEIDPLVNWKPKAVLAECMAEKFQAKFTTGNIRNLICIVRNAFQEANINRYLVQSKSGGFYRLAVRRGGGEPPAAVPV